MEDENHLFTVGHSNVDMENFLELVRSQVIELIVDVRSSPYSKYVPQFNRENLKANLESEGVGYEFLGDKIGGKPRDEKYYEDGKVVYSLIEAEPSYKEGISQLMELLKTRKTSLMKDIKITVEKHPEGYVAYSLGFNGVVVGEGDTFDAAISDVKSAIEFHIETFGNPLENNHH